ncbi:DUF6545 domain-containing protein [Streptomyces sp. NPDC102441]|uniref:DUF6545 domain-containing protein n=1 Tax=Streptomyces sp. NPDC102441 TaxID=3366176 RepID=UPI0038063751
MGIWGVAAGPPPCPALQQMAGVIHVLALRSYSSRQVQEAAEQSVGVGTQAGAAIVEAAVVKGALSSMRAGRRPKEIATLPGGFAAERGTCARRRIGCSESPVPTCTVLCRVRR